MKEQNAFIYIKKIKIFLVFFCALLLFNCKNSNKDKKSRINIETKNPENISFNSHVKLDDLSIVLESQPDIPVLGKWMTDGLNYNFIPVLPFTIGETYQIMNKGEVIYVFTISRNTFKSPSQVLAIYPTTDSVPENLLKMYVVFSKPMQQTRNSLDYITVYDDTSKKEVSVFLELQNELWNKDHTVLTLWLDPGRVKTDLIPNKKLGLPLQKDHNYTITINPDWKDAQGQPIGKAYSKTLIVGSRDSEKPEIKNWILNSPKKNTNETLIINFNEAIDYFLAMESFTLFDSKKNIVGGTFSLSNKEHKLLFYPHQEWEEGTYAMSIEVRLEDLAGNNLNHPFDTDLKTKNSKVQTNNDVFINLIVY